MGQKPPLEHACCMGSTATGLPGVTRVGSCPTSMGSTLVGGANAKVVGLVCPGTMVASWWVHGGQRQGHGQGNWFLTWWGCSISCHLGSIWCERVVVWQAQRVGTIRSHWALHRWWQVGGRRGGLWGWSGVWRCCWWCVWVHMHHHCRRTQVAGTCTSDYPSLHPRDLGDCVPSRWSWIQAPQVCLHRPHVLRRVDCIIPSWPPLPFLSPPHLSPLPLCPQTQYVPHPPLFSLLHWSSFSFRFTLSHLCRLSHHSWSPWPSRALFCWLAVWCRFGWSWAWLCCIWKW